MKSRDVLSRLAGTSRASRQPWPAAVARRGSSLVDAPRGLGCLGEVFQGAQQGDEQGQLFGVVARDMSLHAAGAPETLSSSGGAFSHAAVQKSRRHLPADLQLIRGRTRLA